MGEAVIDKKPALAKDNQWSERIAEQERSGLSVKQSCKDRAVSEYSFYTWRKRLTKKSRCASRWLREERPATDTDLELVMASGDRLHIGNKVNAATLRTVLEALRA